MDSKTADLKPYDYQGVLAAHSAAIHYDFSSEREAVAEHQGSPVSDDDLTPALELALSLYPQYYPTARLAASDEYWDDPEPVKELEFNQAAMDNLHHLWSFYQSKPIAITAPSGETVMIYLYLLQEEIGSDDKYAWVSKTQQETIEMAQVFFNRNSIELLNSQILSRHVEMTESAKMIHTIREWLYLKVEMADRAHFLLMGSAVLYLHGMREMNDVDLYIDGALAGPGKDAVMDDLLGAGGMKGIDAIMPGTRSWKNHWESWAPAWADLAGAHEFRDFVYNPQYHFYYRGMKVMTKDVDVIRRQIRNRPKAHADLIMYNHLLCMNIGIPAIPETYERFYRDPDLVGMEASPDAVRRFIKARYASLAGLIAQKPVKITLNSETGELCFVFRTDPEIFAHVRDSALRYRYGAVFNSSLASSNGASVDDFLVNANAP